mmetsp:Transcript_1367/g.2994  ORF Transcript_1367/g.2994 Transcript_1367/m.2994 type:complete len:165 (-) Transcript_1367:1867-2361(-)
MALKDVYTSTRPLDSTHLSNFEPAMNRRMPNKCPKGFPALDSANWRAVDRVRNLPCPSLQAPVFQCSALSSSTEEQQPQVIPIPEIVLEKDGWDGDFQSLVCGLVFLMAVAFALAHMKHRHLNASKDVCDDATASSDEESAGLLPMKNYGSLDSGSSSLDESKA